MDIEPLNVDQSLCGHQINQKRPKYMYITIIGTTVLGRVVTIVKNMDTFLKNCIRTHFIGSYNRWLSQTTCFNCLKIGNITKYCPTKSKAPNSEFNKGKEKVDVENIRGEMNRTWKRRGRSSISNGGITLPKRSSSHTSSN